MPAGGRRAWGGELQPRMNSPVGQEIMIGGRVTESALFLFRRWEGWGILAFCL